MPHAKPLHEAFDRLIPSHMDGGGYHSLAYSLREEIDRVGRGLGACDVWLNSKKSRLDIPNAQHSYLMAWCAHRTFDAHGVVLHVPRALRYFEDLGAVRRQAEAHLLLAWAYDELGRDEKRDKHALHASLVLRVSHEPVMGSRRDPFSGDLPYLLAKAEHRGFGVATRNAPKGVRVKRSMRGLFELAWAEYVSFEQSFALPHVARARAQAAADQGHLVRASLALSYALDLDRRAHNKHGLHHDFLLFSRLARNFGAKALGHAVQDWLVAHLGADYLHSKTLCADTHVRAFPRTHKILRHMLRTHAGRAKLSAQLELMRASSVRPKRHMLSLFTRLKDLSPFVGDAWRLAFSIGRVLHEQGMPHHARRYLERAIRAQERLLSQAVDQKRRLELLEQARPIRLEVVRNLVGVGTRNLTQRDYRKALEQVSRLKAQGLRSMIQGATFKSTRKAQDLLLGSFDALGLATHLVPTLKRWSTKDSAQLVDVTRTKKEFALPYVPSGSVALEYIIGPRSGFVWVLDHTGVLRVRRVDGWDTLSPLIGAFERTLRRTRASQKDALLHKKLAERLYVALLAPIQDLIVDVDHLIIAPDKGLTSLPFEALAKPSRARTPQYLVRTRSLSYAPSLEVLALIQERQKNHPRAPARALMLGAPSLSQSGVELLTIGQGVPHKGMFKLHELFPNIPWSVFELRTISKILTKKMRVATTVLMHKKATEFFWRKASLHMYRYIHIATHGLSDASDLRSHPHHNTFTFTQPALLLAREDEQPDDGVLHLEELLLSKTRAKLVVLSGCTTGRGWRALGEGSYGLAGAFLATGSASVIASLWNVADRPTSLLMSRMYTHMGRGHGPSKALRAAQMELMKMTTKKGGALPPFYWAGFRLIGQH